MTYWKSRNGRRIPITKLHDNHLKNIIRGFRRNADAIARRYQDPGEIWPIFDALLEEANKRGLVIE